MWKSPSWDMATFPIIFVIFCACCGFWPYAAGFRITELEHSPLRQSLNEQLINVQGSIASLALLIPLFFDWLADLFVSYVNRKNKDNTDEMVTNVEKAVLFISLASAPILAFVSCDSLALLWFCLTRFQVVAVVGTFRVCLSRYDSRVWSWWSTMLSVMIVTVSLNLTTWTSMTNNHSGSIAILATTLKAIALAMNFFQSGLFLLRQFSIFIHHWLKKNNINTAFMSGTKKMTKSKVEPSNRAPSSMDVDEMNMWMEKMFFPILFVSLELISHFIVVISFIVLGSASQFRTENLLIYKMAFIIVEIGLLFYYMRKIKYESLYNLEALIESRKQYLRYIAHEMRTPLNSAVLGLKLICDSLATIENKDDLDYELSETAGDVSKTIGIAVEILADLMTFNKIEGGLMKLHKQEIVVKDYIQDVVDTVSAEAREKSISIAFKKGFRTLFSKTNDTPKHGSLRRALMGSSRLISKVFPSSIHNDQQCSHEEKKFAMFKGNDEFLDLMEEDKVFADKFKMDQVLRNLLSNALKFSPRGSVITIRAAFQPIKKTRSKNFEPSQHGSVAFNMVSKTMDKLSQDTTSFFAKLWQSTKILIKKRVADHVDENDVEKGEIGMDNVLPSVRQKTPEDLYQGGELVIMVTDLGAGISKENQQELFQEGMQFNPEKLQTGGGSGFGLFISKSIVQLHGGTLKAYSAGEGKGSSFIFKVPMTRMKSASVIDPWQRASNSASNNISNNVSNNVCDGNKNEEHDVPLDNHDENDNNHHFKRDHSIQPSLKMPLPTRARAWSQHDNKEDDRWSYQSGMTPNLSKHDGMRGSMAGIDEDLEIHPTQPPPMESQCGGGTGDSCPEGDSNQQGQGQIPSIGSRDAAVGVSEAVLMNVVNRPIGHSPGLNSSQGSHGATSHISRNEMARKLSVARSTTLLAVSPALIISQKDLNRRISKSHFSEDGIRPLCHHSPSGGVRKSNVHHHQSPSDDEINCSRSASAGEERNPTVIHVDHRSTPIHSTFQPTSDQPRNTSTLPPIRESNSMVLKIEGNSAPKRGSKSIVLNGEVDPSPLFSPSHSSDQSAHFLIPDDGAAVSGKNNLIHSSVVNQFSHSSNSKTRLDTLVEGNSGNDIGETLLNASNDMVISPSPIAAISSIARRGSNSGSRRNTRQLIIAPKVITQSRLFHLLVVDDSAMSRKMLMKTLKNIGHTCDEAEDGSIAVDKVKEKGLTTYDAILMDFVMPVMDGPDATKAIRDLGYTAPIIGCTGNTLDMDLLRFKECGCDRVIGKPFLPHLFHLYMDELTPIPSSPRRISSSGTPSGDLTGRSISGLLTGIV